MRDTSDMPEGRPPWLGIITWLGVFFFGGWLVWCAFFQFGSVATDAEIIETRTEHRRTKRGRKTSEVHGVVRYADQAGIPHTDEVQLYGLTDKGRKIAVRYLPSRPDDCRRDDFWDIWGLSVMASGVFTLTVGLMWIAERRLNPRRPAENPFRQTDP